MLLSRPAIVASNRKPASTGPASPVSFAGSRIVTGSSNFDLGPAASNRFVIVGVFSQTTTGQSITVSAGGVSLPQLLYVSNRNRLWIHGALVPAGSGLLDVTTGVASGAVRLVAVWVARGYVPSGLTAQGLGTGTTPSSATLTTNPGDYAVALSGGYQAGEGGYTQWSSNLHERVLGAGTQPGAAADGGPSAGSSMVGQVTWFNASGTQQPGSLGMVGLRAAG